MIFDTLPATIAHNSALLPECGRQKPTVVIPPPTIFDINQFWIGFRITVEELVVTEVPDLENTFTHAKTILNFAILQETRVVTYLPKLCQNIDDLEVILFPFPGLCGHKFIVEIQLFSGQRAGDDVFVFFRELILDFRFQAPEHKRPQELMDTFDQFLTDAQFTIRHPLNITREKFEEFTFTCEKTGKDEMQQAPNIAGRIRDWCPGYQELVLARKGK